MQYKDDHEMACGHPYDNDIGCVRASWVQRARFLRIGLHMAQSN
jgi:hypothetical protein